MCYPTSYSLFGQGVCGVAGGSEAWPPRVQVALGLEARDVLQGGGNALQL